MFRDFRQIKIQRWDQFVYCFSSHYAIIAAAAGGDVNASSPDQC